jgi:N-acetylglucosamine-6-phosphate deacetylase
VIVLSGADLVLPDRILGPGTLVMDAGRIVEIRPGGGTAGAPARRAFHGHYVVPGFIDVHVHGVDGIDSLGEGHPVAEMAARLPRYGTTAFCPTTVACSPSALRRVLEGVREARRSPSRAAARVLPAHLESNFINPDYRGAQPASCLRRPRPALEGLIGRSDRDPRAGQAEDDFDGTDVLVEVERAAPDVGIVTIAPELDGSLDLIRWLCARGHRVGLGHSSATYEQALDAVAAGARHATHLFNRMPPLDHRSPGLAGAVLQAEEVAAEIICDGVHVHPAMVRMAVAGKQPSRMFAITDGTALSGLPSGATARIGDQPLTAGKGAAWLADGTLAGSVATMDRVFRTLAGPVGLSLVDASTMCSTTAARELGLLWHGILAPGAVADVVVLDAQLEVVQTYIGGDLAFSREGRMD